MSFSLLEILALIGATHCTYLIVHICFGFRKIARAGLPLLFFTVLGLAFSADLAQNRLEFEGDLYFYIQWFLWFSGPPLSVLLVIQLADMSKPPPLMDFWVLLLLPLSFALSFMAADTAIGCTSLEPCKELRELLKVTGLMAGTISLLVTFSKKDLLKNLAKQKFGKERYWLIFSLIILSTCFLFVMLLALMNYINLNHSVMLRNIMGIGFVYLVSTTFLRIFPQTQRPAQSAASSSSAMTQEEQELAKKIEDFMQLEKVYQEPTYSRADLARECKTSETLISRVINLHFDKSFPQLMNESRIEDAKRLLRETDATIQTISSEVGFNSLPSFNRVFKDMTGIAPSKYRKNSSQNEN